VFKEKSRIFVVANLITAPKHNRKPHAHNSELLKPTYFRQILNRIYSQPYHSPFPAQEFKTCALISKMSHWDRNPCCFTKEKAKRCGKLQKRLASVATISGSRKDSGITQIREGLIARDGRGNLVLY
jgi:hypothetical protein